MFTCLILPTSWLICLFLSMLGLINKVVHGTRAHQNTWGRVSQAQKWVRKRDNEIPKLLYQMVKRLFGMDASRYADEPWRFFCTCAVVFPPKWSSRCSWHHLMMSWGSFMCKREGTIKRGAQLSSRSLAAAITVIWVFRHKC